jgi:copper transport protein
MVLLVGGAIFLMALWPKGLVDRRARRLLAAAWGTLVVATVLGFGFQAAYREGVGLDGIVDTGAIGDVLGSRPGRVWLLRLALLAVVAVVGVIASRRLRAAGTEPGKQPRAATALTAGLGLALLATITFAGHAAAGDLVGLAVVTDLVHLSAISVWLGGLATMFAVVLRRVDRNAASVPPSTVGAAGTMTDVEHAPSTGTTGQVDVEEMAGVVARFSRWAFVAVLLVVTSGSIQAWRQLRGLEALFDTTYGRVLMVKVALVLVVLTAAGVSREWVYRRRAWLAARTDDNDDDEETVAPNKPLSVRTLRRSAGAEVVVAALVLSVTALLVNTVPGKDALSPTYASEEHGTALLVDVEVNPAKAGPADISITTLTHQSEPFQPPDVRASLSLPARDVPAMPVALESTSTGVYVASDFEIPFPGTWTLTVDVRTSEFDQETFTFPIPVK